MDCQPHLIRERNEQAQSEKEGLHEKKEKQMRRTIVLLTTMAMTLLVATSVAMADTVACMYNPIALDQDTCFGTNEDDEIYGTVANDTIFAHDGNDDIYALRGNDSIVAHEGDDRIVGGRGDDDIHGAEGMDTANFYASPAPITASLATNEATGEGDDFMTGIENLVGSRHNDMLTGSIGANTLNGLGGKDSLSGGDGNDTINARDGNADGIISCGAGSDTVIYDQFFDDPPGGDCEVQRPVF
jgi:Ca2+-binding RTX toxin-like protein